MQESDLPMPVGDSSMIIGRARFAGGSLPVLSSLFSLDHAGAFFSVLLAFVFLAFLALLEHCQDGIHQLPWTSYGDSNGNGTVAAVGNSGVVGGSARILGCRPSASAALFATATSTFLM